MLSKLRRSVHSRSNLDSAWRKIQANGRNSQSDDVRVAIERFAQDPSKHIAALQRKLSRDQFDFGQARGAPIPKLDQKGRPTGKVRPIVIGTLEARITQRAILQVLCEIPALSPFIATPFSFGGIRRKRNLNGERDDSLSAVPAAIEAVLQAIDGGARWVACADITSFFTRISKSSALSTVSSAVHDSDLEAILKKALAFELSNLEQISAFKDQFPIEDIGVAQGNSLSPLMGNVVLHEFDRIMNEGDCRCIRYIDDFIILAPSKKAANARLLAAQTQLKKLGMELSEEKSSKEAVHISSGFEFLGIEIVPGLVRPARKSRTRFLKNLNAMLDESQKAMHGVKHGNKIDERFALIQTLKRVNGMIDGWGKHYWFCNDREIFRSIDSKVNEAIKKHLGVYSSVRQSVDPTLHQSILGLNSLANLDLSPFQYPSLAVP